MSRAGCSGVAWSELWVHSAESRPLGHPGPAPTGGCLVLGPVGAELGQLRASRPGSTRGARGAMPVGLGGCGKVQLSGDVPAACQSPGPGFQLLLFISDKG